jgi:hypothetical protein
MLIADRELRGWNGTLLLGANGIVIKGLLVRKRRDEDCEIAFDQIAAVRYVPANRGLVGYVMFAEHDAPASDSSFLASIRDDRAITFVTRSEKWRRVAEEVAARSGVPLDVAAPPPYLRTAFAVGKPLGGGMRIRRP